MELKKIIEIEEYKEKQGDGPLNFPKKYDNTQDLKKPITRTSVNNFEDDKLKDSLRQFSCKLNAATGTGFLPTKFKGDKF